LVSQSAEKHFSELSVVSVGITDATDVYKEQNSKNKSSCSTAPW